jgi:hypothetical protein
MVSWKKSRLDYPPGPWHVLDHCQYMALGKLHGFVTKKLIIIIIIIIIILIILILISDF